MPFFRYALLVVCFCLLSCTLSAQTGTIINYEDNLGPLEFTFAGIENDKRKYINAPENLTFQFGTRWEIILTRPNPADSEVLFYSDVCTELNPPDLATGNWVDNQAGDGTTLLGISGSGTTATLASPTLSVTPAGPVDFGSVTVTGGKAMSFNLSLACGPATGVSITSDNPAFVVSGLASDVVPVAGAEFQVAFTPLPLGQEIGTITISYGQGDDITFAVSGLGTMLDQAVVNFTDGLGTIVNTYAGQENGKASFQNVAGNLSILFQNGRWEILFTGNGTPELLNFNTTVTENLVPDFNTGTWANNNGTLVALDGSGTTNVTSASELSYTPAGPVSFGEVSVGGSEATSLTLVVTGNPALDVSAVSNNPSFSITSGPSATISGSSAMEITFSPTAAGPQMGTVTVSSSNANDLIIPVSGTGVVDRITVVNSVTGEEVSFATMAEAVASVPDNIPVTILVQPGDYPEEFNLSAPNKVIRLRIGEM